MLISLAYKFIFIANIKAGSSTIENALGGLCEICIDQTSFGKHASLGEIERRFGNLFDIIPRPEFRIFGVIRDPVDWMYSIYRSHKSVPFENTALDTTDMTFDMFLSEWVSANPGHCIPQRTYFNDMMGRFGADYLLRFDHLEDDFRQVLELLSVPSHQLGHFNASVDLPLTEAVSDEARASLSVQYRDDLLLRATMAGRWLNDEDRLTLGRRMPDDALVISEADSRERIQKRRRFVTRDDVIWAYRMLLNRDPENDDVIEEHRALETRDALRAHIMQSLEFRSITNM